MGSAVATGSGKKGDSVMMRADLEGRDDARRWARQTSTRT